MPPALHAHLQGMFLARSSAISAQARKRADDLSRISRHCLATRHASEGEKGARTPTEVLVLGSAHRLLGRARDMNGVDAGQSSRPAAS
jgi:hypothetical protein